MSDTEEPVAQSPKDSMVTIRLSDAQDDHDLAISTRPPSTGSTSNASRASLSSSTTDEEPSAEALGSVDWEGLERTEEQEPRDEGTDESTALLLARLEQENAALAGNPKSALARTARPRSNTRPPSIQQLKKLVNGSQRNSLRYSMLPAPPMTELEFWAALVSDYPQTAQRLPTLTSNKIRGGVPPPLRGVVWPSIAGARDVALIEEFEKLSNETSPYEGLIGKDVGRSFPNVEMFKDSDGEGQQMLGRVLRCFSLHDAKIGYCQGLGFVVGPLLMHMSDAEAFCVLVRLMEHYDLRSCYLPDLAGLHLRIYQFQTLLSRHLPELTAHLNSLKIEPLYVSQWFLSFFAVTCPLPMLLRIYDIILSEGATETLMRVALSLMQRNQKKLLLCYEFEDAMQLLLSRGLWDTYAQCADDLVTDFVSLTGLVSRESLHTLEKSFKESNTLSVSSSLKSAASQFLGRFWTGSIHISSMSSGNLGVGRTGGISSMRKVSSGHSISSTSHSVESTSDASSLGTETSELPGKTASIPEEGPLGVDANMLSPQDRALHHQIEELLTALSAMQREHAQLAQDLQREREEREDDREVGRALLKELQFHSAAIQELVGDEAHDDMSATDDLIQKASAIFTSGQNKRQSISQTKHQLRESATQWKEKFDIESARCQELMRHLDDRETEQINLKDQLRDARVRVQDGHRDKQRLEKTIQELRKCALPDTPTTDTHSPGGETAEGRPNSLIRPGLREFKLGKPDAARASVTFSKRSSSLSTQGLLSTENHAPVGEDVLLLELVNSKTAEATAKQELEETKVKLESLRKILGGTASSPLPRVETGGLTLPGENPFMFARTPTDSPKSAMLSAGGGFFSAWAKRTG